MASGQDDVHEHAPRRHAHSSEAVVDIKTDHPTLPTAPTRVEGPAANRDVLVASTETPPRMTKGTGQNCNFAQHDGVPRCVQAFT